MLAVMALTVTDGALVYSWVQRHLNGPSLARYVTGRLNPGIRGRVDLDSVTWSGRAVVDLLRNRPHSVELRGLRVHDPDGTLVLSLPQAQVGVDLKQLIRSRFMLSDLRAAGGLVIVAEKRLSETRGELGLAAAFEARPAPGPQPKAKGPAKSAGPVLLLRSARLESMELVLDFPGATPGTGWGVRLVGLRAGADLRFDGRAPRPKVDLAFTGREVRAAGGSLRIGTIVFPLEDLDARLLAMRQSRAGDMEFDATMRLAGAQVRAVGVLTRVFYPDAGVDLALHLTGAGGAARVALGPIFGGPARGDFTIRGRFVDGPVIDGDLGGVTATIGPLQGTGVSGKLHLDTTHLAIDAIQGAVAGGTVRGQLNLDLAGGSWSTRATLSDLDAGRLIEDRKLARLLAGRLSGSARASAPFVGPLAVRIDDVDLALRRTGPGPLPRQLRARGSATVRPASVDVRGLELSTPGATVTARGKVLTQRRELDLAVTVAATQAQTVLAALEAPPILASLEARARVTGKLDRPVVDGDVTMQDVGLAQRRFERLTGHLRLREGLLALEDLRGTGFGGTTTGRASIRLFAGTVARPLRDPRLSASLEVRRLKLERLAGSRDLTGTIDGEVAIDGPLSSPTGHAALRSGDLLVYGDPYAEAAAEVDIANRVVTARRVTLKRQGGGALEGKGSVGFGGALDLDVAASAFPLGAIPRLNELPVPIDGQLSGQLHVGGDVSHPSVGGYVALMATRVRNILFGNGTLKLEPGGDAIRLSGTFFDRLKVDGYLTVAPRPVLFVRIAFDRMPLETLVPELAFIDTKGIMSGAVQLTITGDGLTDAQVRLTELALTVEPARRETEEERKRFEIRNKHPVRLTYVDGRVTFEHLHLVSGAGELEVTGSLAAKGSDARARGNVSLELLEYLTGNVFDHTHGDASVDLRLTGALAKPTLAGSLEVRRGSVVLREADRPITIPRARFDVTADAVTARDVVLSLDGASVTVNGRLALADFKPGALTATVRGDLSARALQYALPRYFSEASGLLGLNLDVEGLWRDPRVGGRIAFKNVDVMARALGREVIVRSGTIVLPGATPISDGAFRLRDLRGALDEGEFILDGHVDLAAWEPAALDVRFQGMGIPNRVPRVYELSVNTDLKLRLDDERQLRLEGVVDVVDGRYVQRFDLLKGVLEPSRTHVEGKPFWAGVPWLANMLLGLQVRTGGSVFVRNNLADMTLDMALEVGGTLERTELAGEIRTVEGSFSIPFMRGRFTVQEGGTVAFVRGKSVPKETPEVNIIGETVYTDSREQEHLITLTLHGPLATLGFDLHSNTGLNTSQCIALLSTGRTTDEVRAMVTGRQEGVQTPGSVAAADQAFRQITGDFMSMLIEDPLKKTLGLDLAQLALGTESIEVKLGWRIGRHLKLLGSHEMGLLGDSHSDGRAEVKLSDYVLVIPEVERLVRGQQTEQETIIRGKAQLKLRLNLR